MSRPPRRRRRSALLRGRLRTLFFLCLAALCLTLGAYPGAALAATGAVLGALSIAVGQRRGDDHALSFAVTDWLVLAGAALATGGASSWLLLAIPLLTLAQLAPSPPAEWPYLLSGSLLLLVILAIDDGTLGGGRAAGLAKLFVLVAGGVIAARQVRRPRRRRRPRVVTVDPTTGFYAAGRLRPMLADGMRLALQDHQSLSVVRLRLEHFEDGRAFLGPQAAEELVRGVARRIGRRLGPDDVAFRTAADTFVLCLPGTGLGAAQELAGEIAHEIGATLIAGRRQTLAAGAASFPAVRTLDELLAEAEGRPREVVLEAPAFAAPLAAAQ
ncbi:MAG: diguanylate cyclase [Thermoleophilia bacterium]|nr:diguanylate cyclase [Thermoleophilia bacterium]